MKEKITALIQSILEENGVEGVSINVEIPKNKQNGDYSTNIALICTKILNKNPMEIAEIFSKELKADYIDRVEIAKPGFINFYVKNDYLKDNINNVINLDGNYGRNNIGKGKKINIEFVSANPTGILHMGNARGGAYGDSLARIMSFSGFDVTKEYYMNDAGNQINKLANSILSRYLDLCGVDNEFPENGYPGEEIKTIAKGIFDTYGNSLNNDNMDVFKSEGVKYLSSQIFKDLREYRIEYDVVTSEKSIYDKYPMKDTLELLDANGYIYTKEDATWFKSSALYDDKDHVLVKSDGSYTYLLPDINYHMDKLKRGYDELVDVLGTDHHGYVARLKGAIKAIGYDDSKLDVRLLQLVRIVKNNEVQAMHKRSGNVITLKELVDEVGVNAARYFFSKYSLDTQMDFDIELAKSRSNENPVFYVCYAYARICSILNNYSEEVTLLDNYDLVDEQEAFDVLSCVYNFPSVVESACKKKTPHVITNYVYELASLFHTYYEKCRIISDDKQKTLSNLNLIKSVKITLFNALNLVGVVPEERM